MSHSSQPEPQLPPDKGRLAALADRIIRRPWLLFWAHLVLTLVCLWYAVTELEFSAKRSDLVSEEVKYQREFAEFKREFRMPDPMVAVVESESQEKNRRFVERLASRLKEEPDLFSDTYYKGDLRMLGPKALLFLSEGALQELQKVVEGQWGFIQTYAQTTNLAGVLMLINRDLREAEADAINKEDLLKVLPVLRNTLDEATRAISEPLANSFPGLTSLFGDQSKLYVTFAAGQIYAVVTHATNPNVEERAVNRLRALVAETMNEVPGINAGISGEPVLNFDEMRQSQHDINVAAIFSMGIVALIFIYGFHETTRPLLATLSLLVGIIYAIGFTTLTVGRLNLLTITIVPILIGLGIDFGVHLISRYEEALKSGRARQDALREALAWTGRGIFTSAFATAGAFFAMVLTDFRGVQEMGFISGAGLLLCVVPMVTLLPMLLSKERSTVREYPELSGKAREWLEQVWLRRPRFVLLVAGMLTLLAGTQIRHLDFDYNLLKLQSRELPAVGIEEKLVKRGSQSLLYGVVVADSLEQASELEEKLEKLNLVKGVTSMVDFLTADQENKLRIVTEIKRRAESLRLAEPDKEAVNVEAVSESLFALEGYLGLALEALQKEPDNAELVAEIDALRKTVIRLRTVTAMPTPTIVERLTEFQRMIFSNLHETVGTIREQDVSGRLELKDLPPFLREQYISPSGKFLLQVYPKGDVWQRPNQEQFITVLRSVAPGVTGTLVQMYEYTALIKKNFTRATLYASGIIALILLVEFRSLRAVVLALTPVVIGLTWMLGIMGWLQIDFNPVNIMALTLLVGIGVANGIHILDRFAEEPQPAILSKSTGKAVLVSAVTTMAGFGSLMVAKHHGIASLGEVMVIGTGTCLVASLGVLPALLTLLNRRVHEKAGAGKPHQS